MDNLCLGIAQVHHHIAALVALDNGAIAVDHDGIGVPEFVQAVANLDIFRVIRGQFLAGIVLCRPQISQLPPFKFHDQPSFFGPGMGLA